MIRINHIKKKIIIIIFLKLHHKLNKLQIKLIKKYCLELIKNKN